MVITITVASSDECPAFPAALPGVVDVQRRAAVDGTADCDLVPLPWPFPSLPG